MSTKQPLPILFHIRHFGVGGIEAALRSWLSGLDRRDFAPALSIYLPTREWEEVYRPTFPSDVAVHIAVPASSRLVAQHQSRRDHQLGSWGRMALGLRLSTEGDKRLRQHIHALQAQFPLIIDFDLSLRRLVPDLQVPVLGVRHFAFWSHLNAKARRVGRQLQAYDRVLVLNEDMRRQALALYGPPNPTKASGEQSVDRGRGVRCAVMPNLFNLAAMAAAANEPLPAGPLTPDPGSYAVCVARLDIPTKGLDTLVRTWAQVVAAQPDAKLVIVGDGPDRAALQQLIQSQGMEQAITLVGMQPNPYPWIAQARLLISSSRSEGSSNVLVEALALETPVVATDCPVGTRDTLQDGACGALVPVDDVGALAKAILHAWSSPEWLAHMAGQGRQRAQYFSAQAGSERLRSVVEEVLQKRGHPRLPVRSRT